METDKPASLKTSKLFLGGLTDQMTVAALSTHFSNYGQVVSCEIMTHPGTARSKGFGFISFALPEEAARALYSPTDHIINGLRVDVREAVTQDIVLERYNQINSSSRKLYIDNVPLGTNKEDLREFFEQLGKVEEISVMHKSKNKKHAFAFVIFEDEAISQFLLESKMIVFRDNELTITKALSKTEIKMQAQKKNSDSDPNSISGKSSKHSNLLSKQSGSFQGSPEQFLFPKTQSLSQIQHQTKLYNYGEVNPPNSQEIFSQQRNNYDSLNPKIPLGSKDQVPSFEVAQRKQIISSQQQYADEYLQQSCACKHCNCGTPIYDCPPQYTVRSYETPTYRYNTGLKPQHPPRGTYLGKDVSSYNQGSMQPRQLGLAAGWQQLRSLNPHLYQQNLLDDRQYVGNYSQHPGIVMRKPSLDMQVIGYTQQPKYSGYSTGQISHPKVRQTNSMDSINAVTYPSNHSNISHASKQMRGKESRQTTKSDNQIGDSALQSRLLEKQ